MSDYAVAIIVNPSMPAGLVANTVGTIAAGLGARFPELLGGEASDKTGLRFSVSSRLPMPVLQATDDELQVLFGKAGGSDEQKVIVPFPTFTRSLHQFEDYQQRLPETVLAEQTLDGIGLCGPRKWVKSLTGSLKLLR
ncbi:DUF2000 domain-containing protein [Entomohabitans teleogrylli]|uniref:DUF2000 domain-containing protein n=1 Tax=Entomohabitans teleogrylli TaxID=1384589 RepID=UPI00073D3DBB|nr:DUF2000 domain-containing protein [Entomohabitans teleogrylli]